MQNGIYEAGGIPLDLPVVSLGETQVRPTAMLWRNMAAMATEEMLRANPIDGVVLLGGCDKTIPSLLMAAASVDLPAVVVPGRADAHRHLPRRAARLRHRRLAAVGGGAGRHAVAGGVHPVRVVDDPQPRALQHDGHRVDDGAGRRGARHGRCPASPAPRRRTAGCSRRPTRPAGWPWRWSPRTGARAPSSRRRRSPTRSWRWPRSAGRPTPSSTCWRSPAGSGIDLTLDDFDRIGSRVPVLVDLLPAGRFLMDDLHRAGGLLAVLARGPRPARPDRADRHRASRSSTTSTTRPIWDPEVIRPRSAPLVAEGGIAVLRGNLAPDGALIKPAAASPHLLRHRGRAVVFDSIEDFHARIDDPDLDVDADSVLVLRGCGPKGYPGMPEVANMPLPAQAARAGRARHGAGLRRPDERHRLRHRRPARRPGGGRRRPAGAGPHRRRHQPRRRRPPHRRRGPGRRARPAHARRGHGRGLRAPAPRLGTALRRHVQQADTGADLDFLVGSSGSAVSRESH